MEKFKTMAMVASLNAKDEVTILEHKDNNNVIAEYKGKKYTAVYNVFVNCYYVDDKYGNIEEIEKRKAEIKPTLKYPETATFNREQLDNIKKNMLELAVKKVKSYLCDIITDFEIFENMNFRGELNTKIYWVLRNSGTNQYTIEQYQKQDFSKKDYVIYLIDFEKYKKDLASKDYYLSNYSNLSNPYFEENIFFIQK